MLRKSKSPVPFEFERSGGSLITARVDIWKATEDGWLAVGACEFNDPTAPNEQAQVKLDAGSYTCVFQCSVEESINGVYEFTLTVGGKATFADKGDVNTTMARDDQKVFKDQFILEVQKGRP
jgi:hypothetical protein